MSLENKLRDQIYNDLQNVSVANAPKINDALQTESGYQNIEERIITLVCNENLTPNAAIPHIENMM